MSSSNEKGNISPFLLVIAIITFIVLLKEIAGLMVFRPLLFGKYENPEVAQTVEEGNIYDTNGKALSLIVPAYSLNFNTRELNDEQLEKLCNIVMPYTEKSSNELKNILSKNRFAHISLKENFEYDISGILSDEFEKTEFSENVSVVKTSERTYPFQFHASQLVMEIEKNMFPILCPNPEFNTSVTYGSDIYLTIDTDVQYIMDLACNDMFNKLKPLYVTGLIVNAENGNILAASTYPKYNPDSDTYNTDKQEMNLSLVSEVSGVRTFFVDRTVSKRDGEIKSGTEIDVKKYGFEKPAANPENIYRIYRDNSVAYFLVLDAKDPSNPTGNVFAEAVREIENGLKAQAKL